MQASNIPVKFSIPWADTAGASYIRTIPQASQIGIQNGAASLTDGFPPWTMGANGFPFGQDFNGILKQITQWLQWSQSGGPVQWDSAFSVSIGGYPAGALIQKLNTPGNYWYSTVDNNLTNPDAGGAGWSTFSGGGGSSSVFGPFYGEDTGAADAIVATMSPTLSSFVDGQVFEITPAATNLTSSPVANLSSLGNKSIVHADGTSLLPREITAGAKQLFAYDGSLAKIVFLGISPQRLAVTAQSGAGNWFGTAGGSVNAYTASITPAPAALTAGLTVTGLFSTVNTGASTFSIGLGPNTVIRDDGSALQGGELYGRKTLEFDGSNWRVWGASPPQVTVYASHGTGTYSTPAGARWLEIEMVGAGGGGGGSGDSSSSTVGSAGGDTTFGTLTAHGGPGATHNGAAPNAAATATGGDDNIDGAQGSNGMYIATASDNAAVASGKGAASFYGDGAPSRVYGSSAPGLASVIPGAAGSGAGTNSVNNGFAGSGGNAGAFLRKLITAPASTYAYVVGQAGAYGAAGTNGQQGGPGADGYIKVTAYFG